MLTFPHRFDFPESFQGPLARKLERREAAFQQLVGDALRESIEGKVDVAPTQGRDGSIDIFVGGDFNLRELGGLVRGPVIIECKDNDDRLGHFMDNVTSSWNGVAKRLTKAAMDGWPGLFEPWQNARSYIYVTSAVLPHQKGRQSLTREIKEFFRSLRAKGQLQIDDVRVVDWTDLRSLLDKLPRLGDQWLGIQSSTLVPHEEYLARLAGANRYLVELDYLPPGPGAAAHPETLFEKLRETAEAGRGVALFGAGGVGKTRALLEVAKHACAAKWRVLHLVADGAALDSQELYRELLSGRTHTLIICDYLDRVQLDFQWLQARVIPEARQRNMKLGVLGSTRTLQGVYRSPRARAFFHAVELRLDPQWSQRIRAEMLDKVAPEAVKLLGSKRLEELAGERPIIALFVLTEIERIVASGNLDALDLHHIHKDDLVYWLERRFHEDKLLVEAPASPWEPESVKPHIIAAATVLAASPQPRATLTDVAGQVFAFMDSRAARTDSAPRTATTVRQLEDLGWLVQTHRKLAAAHDAVTDHLLSHILFTKDHGVRDDVLESILEPTKTSPWLFERMATALERLLPAGDHKLANAAQKWLIRESVAIGQGLVTAEPQDASLALWGILRGPPWSRAIPACWDTLIKPWMLCHGRALESNLALCFLGLRKELPEQFASQAIDAAEKWLELHGDEPNAHMVLAPFLDSADLKGSVASRLIRTAWSWCQKHNETEEVGNIVGALLQRTDLPDDILTEIDPTALAWCEQHQETTAPAFVLAMLMLHASNRDTGDQDLVKQAFALGRTWLDKHIGREEAALVLAMLILDERANRKARSNYVKKALIWLQAHGRTYFAGAVFRALLLTAYSARLGHPVRSHMDSRSGVLGRDRSEATIPLGSR